MQKPCPFCGEAIQSVAVKCRYCGEWLDPSRRPDTDATAAAPAPVEPARSPARPETWAPPPAAPTGPQDVMGGTMKGLPVRQFFDPNNESGRQVTQPLAPVPVSEPAPDLSAGTGPSGHVLPGLSAPPPAPPPPAPPRPEPPRPPASRLDDFERSFLGGGDESPADDLGGDAGDDDPFLGRGAPPPAPPWPLIGAVVGGVALVGLLLFKDRLFPPEAPADEVVTVDPAAAPVEEPKVAPPPEPAPAPVQPQTPVIPPPVAVDAAFTDELARARAAYTAGKLKPAAEALAGLAKQAPDHPEVLLLTAQVQLEQEQLPEAQKTADRCVLVDPKLADCWLTLGVLRQNNKDTPGAVAAYEEYLKLAPTGRYARDATSQLSRLKK